MDTITHGIVGVLAGKAFFAGDDVPAAGGSVAVSDPIARAGIAACMIGAIFPDIDVFAGPIAGNPLAIVESHRNVSHSLVLLPVWAGLLAGLTVLVLRWLGWKSRSLAKLAGIYAIGLASHVFLDVITNFGTMVWSPLRYSRVTWDWVYIVDLTLTGLALFPQLIAWCFRDPRKFKPRAIAIWAVVSLAALGANALAASVGTPFPLWVAAAVSVSAAGFVFLPAFGGTGFAWRRANWCRVGFALACIYVGLAAAAHHAALAYAKKFASEQNLRVDTENASDAIAALPIPPGATHWAAVVSTPEGVWRRTFHVPGGQAEGTEFFSNAHDPHVQEARQLRDVQVYLWFARFPVWNVYYRGGETIAEVSDVRFFRVNQHAETEPADPPAEQSSQSSNHPADSREDSFLKRRRGSNGFAYDVIFDAQGHIVSSRFRKETR